MKMIVKRLIKEGKVEEIIAVYKELITLTKVEQGCIAYQLYQDDHNPRLLAIIEEWENDEVLQAHLQTEHFLRLFPKLNELTEKKYDLERYHLLFS